MSGSSSIGNKRCSCCQKKILMEMICPACQKDFCFRHRFPDQHDCSQINEFLKKKQNEWKQQLLEQKLVTHKLPDSLS